MKAYEEFEEANDKLRVALRNPENVAELYFEMDNTQQARFWDFVAQKFAALERPAAACQQSSWVACDSRPAAAEFIKNLAEHIRLLEEDKAA